MKNTRNSITLAISGGAFAISIATCSANASENPFALKSLASGYQVADIAVKMKDGDCSADMKMKDGDCSAEMKKEMADKAAVASEKSKDGSCSAEKKMKDGDCSAEMKNKAK